MAQSHEPDNDENNDQASAAAGFGSTPPPGFKQVANAKGGAVVYAIVHGFFGIGQPSEPARHLQAHAVPDIALP